MRLDDLCEVSDSEKQDIRRANKPKTMGILHPPPCDECQHKRICATHKLACTEYQTWAVGPGTGHTSRQATRIPSRQVYLSIFSNA